VQGKFFDKFNKLKCCVLIPTYNNAGTLEKVLNGVLCYTSNVIVVNDGSTDSTRKILLNFSHIEVIHQPTNKGKGIALRTGFKAALNKGYEYVITIDSDGQHNVDDLPKFIDSIDINPGSIIIGSRNMQQKNIPGKSSFGHRFSNFWFRVETGIHLPDTQSGYRLYPVRELKNTKYYTHKFEFEIEVLVRAAWNGIPITSVPVSVYYAPDGERVSHFRPFKDFFRISVLNSILVVIAILYARPVHYLKNFNKEKFLKLIGSGEPKEKLALAVGFGVFMGIIPIWGYQMLAAAFLAHLMKLNKALVLLASNISFPPLIPFILYGSLVMGRMFVSKPIQLTFNLHIDMPTVKTGLVQYISGSILLAFSAGIAMSLITYISLAVKRKRS
jgi:glycosyltransferase involved in cell wall biosynthesis